MPLWLPNLINHSWAELARSAIQGSPTLNFWILETQISSEAFFRHWCLWVHGMRFIGCMDFLKGKVVRASTLPIDTTKRQQQKSIFFFCPSSWCSSFWFSPLASISYYWARSHYVYGKIIHYFIDSLIALFSFWLGAVSMHKINGCMNGVQLMLAYIHE